MEEKTVPHVPTSDMTPDGASVGAEPSADPPEMVRWKFAIELLRQAGHDPTDDPYGDLRALLAAQDALRKERDEARKIMSQLAREAAEARGRLEMSEAALDQAAAWFEEYAEHHQAKGALDKASRNLKRASFLRRASHKLDGQP